MPAPAPATTNPPLPPPSKKPTRRRAAWIAAAALAILLALFGFGLYRYQWHGGVAEVVTKVLPYPAAIVEGRVIRYSDFQDDVAVLQKFYDDQRQQAAPGSVFPTKAEITSRVLDRLIKDQLAFSLADRYHVTVTSDEVKKAYDTTILDQASLGTATGKAKAEAQAANTLLQLYGLRPSEFQNSVLYPFLIRQKLAQALRNDDALNAEKKKKAEAALAELEAGKPFRDVALAYSEDPEAAATGGERGMIGRGLLPPEVEAAAFALKPGETSGVVKSALGYHVLRVTARQEANGQVMKVQLEEILIRPIQLDDYLEAQRKTASIVIFVH